MIHSNTPIPTLTVQRSRRNRINIAGFFGALLLVQLLALLVVVRQYTVRPTQDNLIISVFFLGGVFVWVVFLAVLLVPKVEFFADCVVVRSVFGLSQRRSYKDIDTVETKHGHLFIHFEDRSKIALSRSEINFEELARFLAARGVVAVQALAWVSRIGEPH